MQDPYVGFKHDVEDNLKMVKLLHHDWKSLLKERNTTTDSDFLSTNRELNTRINTLCEDLADLQDAVTMMTKNPSMWSLSQKEVKIRQEFVKLVQKTIKDTSNDLVCQATKIKLEKDRRQVLISPFSIDLYPDNLSSSPSPSPSSYLSPDRLSSTRGHASSTPSMSYSTTNNSKQTQSKTGKDNNTQVSFEEQDKQLSILSDTLARIKTISITLSTTLDEDKGLLDDIDHSVDNTSNKLQRSDTRLKRLFRKL